MKTAPDRPLGRSGARARWSLRGGLFGLALVASVLGSLACSSMDKQRVERELLGLAGKQALREHGLSTLEARPGLGAGPIRASFTYQRFEFPGADAEPGAPLVFVHGTPGSLLDWSALIGELSERGLDRPRVLYTLDLVGHGVTRTQAPPYTFASCARWIAAFLAELDLRDVVLVGHSYGGEMVWRTALAEPARVARVVLIDSAGFERPPGGFLPEEQAMRSNPLARWGYVLNSRARIRRALEPHYLDGVPDERVEEVYLLCANRDNWRAMVDLVRDENGEFEDELARLAQPTLLIWGSEDLAYPVESVARRFERTIRGAQLLVIEGTGHYPHEERPREVAAALVEFLARD